MQHSKHKRGPTRHAKAVQRQIRAQHHTPELEPLRKRRRDVSAKCEINLTPFKIQGLTEIIAINLIVISSPFLPKLHFFGHSVTVPEGSCSFGAFRSNLPPDEAVSFIQWDEWDEWDDVLPTNRRAGFLRGVLPGLCPAELPKTEKDMEKKDEQTRVGGLRGLIFVTKTCQDFIHLIGRIAGSRVFLLI